MADALTSLLAILALLLGRINGGVWADAGVGVIARWWWGLIHDAGGVLLDAIPRARAYHRRG